ncbi:site-specific integrase [Thiomicrorhabdus sp. 6S2-11]|uniref:Site-specific integrase n=1 Tax=Thiomicrorhabdus marina TaxID=2818442 RepID=A0ABS3Q4V6_9GAMM|nr:site-specific integrase [Thiomicrorhabdus marina]MBO1927374.1 site-specific integrase [Thiomicrorhabdus marina]
MHFVTTRKSDFHQCHIFMAQDLSVLLLPTFFSMAVNRYGVVWKRVKVDGEHGFSKTFYKEEEVTETTIANITNRLERFLNWVIEYSQLSEYVSLDNHHNLPEDLLNHYINDVLIEELKSGEHSIDHHLMALRDYYNYLSMTGFTDAKDIRVKPRLKATVKRNTKQRTAVKYLTPELRSILYQNTNSIKDELLLRTGGELGLRSKENQGLLLADFQIGTKRYSGFLSLFSELESNPDKTEFTYYLQGKFTKAPRGSAGGGNGRMLYLHRTLLERFKEYYDRERPDSASDTLLVSNAPSNIGEPVSKNSASRAFTTVKKKVLKKQLNNDLPPLGQALEEDHTHHVLRHSFGTDKFYDACKEQRVQIDDVTTTSAVYLLVAALMGHNAAGDKAPATTKTYIRSAHIKEAFMKEATE